MSLVRISLLIAVAAALAGAAACATSSSLGGRASDVHPKLSLTAYIEEGDLLAFLVDTRLAGLRSERDFVPLEVGVANKSMSGLTLSLESFRLVDGQDRSYPAVRGEEVQRGYEGSIDVDRRLGTLLPFMLGRFQAYSLVDSKLTRSFDEPLEVNRVQLPRYSMTHDLLYFPRPEDGIKDGVFTMLLTAEQLEEPIVLRFRVD